VTAPAGHRALACAATMAILGALGLARAPALFAQETARDRATEHVVLVTIDGLRWQELFRGAERKLLDGLGAGPEAERARRFWRETGEARRKALLPFLWGVMAEEGQLIGNPDLGSHAVVTNGRYFSYPGYSELLSGHADDRIKSNAKRPNPNVTVLEWLNGRPGFEGRVAAFGSWDVFPYIINAERSGVYVNAGWQPTEDGSGAASDRTLDYVIRNVTPVWENVRFDVLTFLGALSYLEARHPRVLFIALDETDSWAHEGRYDRYLEAAHRFDGFLRTLWETVQQMPAYRGTTTLVVTTDHGRGEGEPEWTKHGAAIEGAERIWMAFLGPDTPVLGEVSEGEEVTQAQVAATMAALLGEDYPAAVPTAASPIRSAIFRREP